MDKSQTCGQMLHHDRFSTSNDVIGAIILAAGRGTRIGGDKMLLPVAGQPMIAHVIAAARAAQLDEPIVVIRPEDVALRQIIDDAGLMHVESTDFELGMAHSLAAGLAAAPAHWDGAFIMLGDMPFIAPALLTAMAQRLTPKAIVIPEHGGRRGNPVLWARRYFAQLSGLKGDTGGRALWGDHAHQIIAQSWHDTSIFADIDTPEDWRALIAPLEASD